MLGWGRRLAPAPREGQVTNCLAFGTASPNWSSAIPVPLSCSPLEAGRYWAVPRGPGLPSGPDPGSKARGCVLASRPPISQPFWCVCVCVRVCVCACVRACVCVCVRPATGCMQLRPHHGAPEAIHVSGSPQVLHQACPRGDCCPRKTCGLLSFAQELVCKQHG